MEFPWDIEVTNKSGRTDRATDYFVTVDLVFEGIEEKDIEKFKETTNNDASTEWQSSRYDPKTKRLVQTIVIDRPSHEEGIITALKE